MTIAQEAVLDEDTETVDFIKTTCHQCGVQLSLSWMNQEGEPKNLMKKALEKKSTTCIQSILELIGTQRTPFIPSSSLMNCYFTQLCAEHHDLVSNALRENCFVWEACHVRVHVKLLDPSIRRQTASHIITTDDYLSWKNVKDSDALGKKWRLKNAATVEDLEKDGNKSTVVGTLKFVCIEDAAKTGRNGILRPLLLKGTPAQIFKTDAVKWVVEYKWHKIRKHRFYWSAVQYAGCLVSVTTYAIILGGTVNIAKEGLWRQIAAGILACLNFVFGCALLKEEVTQLQCLFEDGQLFFQSNLMGISYYFRSRWNKVDLVFCFLLILCIPFSHVFELTGLGHGSFLSACTAIASVLAYVKVSALQTQVTELTAVF